MTQKDLKCIEVGKDEWYTEARWSRAGWRALNRMSVVENIDTQMVLLLVAIRDEVYVSCVGGFSKGNKI